MHPDKLNVFDFDGTLINVNSFRALNKKFLLLLLKKLYLISFIKMVIYYIVRKCGFISHFQFKKFVVQIFEKSLVEYEKKIIIQRIFEDKKNQIIYDIMKNSDNVILTTAAPYAYISRITFNIDEMIYISSLNNANFPDQTNFKEGKVKNIQWLFQGKRISINNFYTDSFDDKPLIDFSLNAFMVKDGNLIKIK